MRYNSIYLIAITLLTTQFVYGQEVCDNCIDDDGDGLIDCYDPECRNDNTSCSNFYIGAINESDNINRCSETFQLNRLWTVPGGFGTAKIYVGDIDNDDTVEILSQNAVYNGHTGNLEQMQPHGAFADVDGDGKAEFFYTLGPDILCSEDDGTIKWQSPIAFANPGLATFLSIADFNFDGIAEVFGNATIYDATNGNLICAADSLITTALGSNSSGRVIAADVLPDDFCSNCEGLELINSKRIFSVDISSGRVQLESEGPSFMNEGQMAIADFDLDGALDIIINSWDAIYVYNPRTGNLLDPPFLYASLPMTNGGMPLVGNFDKDPQPEIGITGSDDSFMVIDHNMTLKWSSTEISDYSGPSSAETYTMFDFNCDGIAEIVHRGGDGFLDIVDARTGAILARDTCNSQTAQDIPIVADINGDNHADIICGCNEGLRAWTGAAPNYWAASRKLVNQFVYFNTHINDDLSVPCAQPNHADPLLPSQLNGFFVQSPLYDGNGIACWPNDKIDVEATIDTIIDLCNDSVSILYSLCNTSPDSIIPANMPYIVYENLHLSGENILTSEVTTSAIATNTCISFNIIVPKNGQVITVSGNDDGLDPLNAPNNQFHECYLPNNLASTTITSEKSLAPTLSFNNTVCDNGAISVIADPDNTTYQYEWSSGDTGQTININSSNRYTVDVVYDNNCYVRDSIDIVLEDCAQYYYIPNAFSPNNDGKNDYLSLTISNNYKFQFNLFDRFGTLVFSTNTTQRKWDGIYNNELATDGVYTYQIELSNFLDQLIMQKGTVQLIHD